MTATTESTRESGDTSEARNDRIEQTFSTGATCRVALDNPRGTVRISGWDNPEVHLVATKRADPSWAKHLATRVDYRHDGATVEIRTVLDPNESYSERLGLSGVAAEVVRAVTDLIGSAGCAADVDYVLQVPRQTSLELKGVSCEFAVEGTRENLRVRSVSGEIDAQDVTGPLDLGSVSGSIDARGVAAPIRIDTVSGEIRVHGRPASLRAKTVSGEIEVSGPLAREGTYDLSSVSGTFTMALPADTAATISLHGLSAQVTTDLPVAVDRDVRGPGRREWIGRLNEGGASVNVRTVSGSLYLQRLTTPSSSSEQTGASAEPRVQPVEGSPTVDDARTDAPSATGESLSPLPSEPVAQPAPDATAEMSVLQALERGELGVDEALRRLAALHARTL